MTLKPICLTFLMSISFVQATALGDMISHLGNTTNFNQAGSFQDQSTGHYSAGGVRVRQRNRSINPINIRLPQAMGSCGNFDMRFGGLSFMQVGEFVEMFKSMSRGMPIYAIQLGLKTYVPQIEQTMKGLQNFLQEVNSMMLNDCQARQQLMEGLLPTGSAMHEQVCLDMRQGGNFNNDYSGARDRCGPTREQNAAAKELQSRHNDLLISEFNLVWNVMKKLPRYKDDVELAQMIMSLVGTVVRRQEGENFKVHYVPPKGDDDKFFDAFLMGGQTEVYVCQETDKCLDISNTQWTVTPERSLSRQVIDNIYGMRHKYLTEEVFSQQEMVFLSDAVDLPVYKYIQISAAARVNYPLVRASQYLAMDILLKHFNDVSAEILDAVSVIEAIQIDSTIVKEFKERLELARTRIHQKIATLDSKEKWMLKKLTQAKETELRANYDYEQGV
ncbi:MAG: conjugal transfer protein TraH [Simkaniaceae bacterium]|nr:conjugal transfer protein TraH [Simkaniaceae bacterium]